MRVLREDFGYAELRPFHADLDDLQGVYLDHPRHTLFVALDDATGAVLGTTGVRAGGPNSSPHPAWLAWRYSPETTAQLYRVYIAPDHRRRGVARALVEAARRWIAAEGGYRVIYLHTNVGVPGAEAFWRSLPTTETYDGRHESEYAPVHFELAFPEESGSTSPTREDGARSAPRASSGESRARGGETTTGDGGVLPRRGEG